MCMACIDQRKADEFGERMLGVLNQGAVALMVSIGHRTGLFDAMARLPDCSSVELAAESDLSERYVREWLGAMLTGGIVEHDAATGRFRLPAEHAGYLTRASAADNVAVFAQYIGLLGSVEDKVVEAFAHGRGVPYEAYGRFHEVMAEDSGQGVVSALVDQVIPLMPGLRERLEEGVEVLDIGCGAGRAMNLLARAFPNSRFAGYDLSHEAIGTACAEAREHQTNNVRFEVRDVTEIGDTGRYDLVTAFDAIHDQAKPDRVLEQVRDALKPDGTFLMVDITGSSEMHKNVDHPLGPMLYTISTMHCMSVSLAMGGPGLGAMWGEEKAREMLAAAGFRSVEVHRFEHDLQNSYYVVRK